MNSRECLFCREILFTKKSFFDANSHLTEERLEELWLDERILLLCCLCNDVLSNFLEDVKNDNIKEIKKENGNTRIYLKEPRAEYWEFNEHGMRIINDFNFYNSL